MTREIRLFDQTAGMPASEGVQQYLAGCDLPLRGAGIPDFVSWVNWNGLHYSFYTDFHGEYNLGGHLGYDLGVYLREDGNIVLGLPFGTKVRAINDGLVVNASPDFQDDKYFGQVEIKHDLDSPLISSYCHLTPMVESGDTIKKGEVVGALYNDPGDTSGRLVHLHFELASHTRDQLGPDFKVYDPNLIEPSLNRYMADFTNRGRPYSSTDFRVSNLPPFNVIVANYKKCTVLR